MTGVQTCALPISDPAGADGEAVAAAAAVELDELDEQPAAARADKATAPVTPASRRTRVRQRVLFMDPSLRSPGITRMSPS